MKCVSHTAGEADTRSKTTEVVSDKHNNGLAQGKHLEKENMQNIK